jgi:hypothetical protein
MKKFLAVFAVAAFLTACNGGSSTEETTNDTTSVSTSTDTTTAVSADTTHAMPADTTQAGADTTK